MLAAVEAAVWACAGCSSSSKKAQERAISNIRFVDYRH